MKRGFLVVQILVFTSISSIILGALAFWGVTSFNASRRAVLREQAFHIAEAGLDYYRWHLAHDSDDYTDGTAGEGPYVHYYNDKDGNQIGYFELSITPPPFGGTTVIIKSKGVVSVDTSVSRTLESSMAIASYSRYALLSGNAILYVGENVDVTGPVHGNNGVRFNGIARNVVSSSVDLYDDTTYSPKHDDMLGVHTDITTADPSGPVVDIPPHGDVFLAGRQFPPFYNISAISFDGLTATLTDIKDASLLPDGFHLDKASGNSSGYHIVLKDDGTFDLYDVGKVHSDPHCLSYAVYQPGWEMGSIKDETFISNNPYPANGIIFVEDNLWLDGIIDGERLTIAAGSFFDNGNGNPQARNITINHNLTYTNHDGTDVLGIIAQNNISVGLKSDDNLRIDGALIAKGGMIGRYYFMPPAGRYTCAPYHSPNSLYLYGMQASYGTGGFSYGDGTGYQNRTIVYDSHLYYNPPPMFPLASSQHSILKWREIKD